MPPQAHATGLVGLAFLLLLSPEPAAGQQTAPEEAVFAMGKSPCRCLRLLFPVIRQPLLVFASSAPAGPARTSECLASRKPFLTR